jgi:hypothetical protein
VAAPAAGPPAETIAVVATPMAAPAAMMRTERFRAARPSGERAGVADMQGLSLVLLAGHRSVPMGLNRRKWSSADVPSYQHQRARCAEDAGQ